MIRRAGSPIPGGRQQRATRRRPPATGQALGLTLERGPGTPPLYRQVCSGIRRAIIAGVLGPGMRLPPERELAAALGVDRTTIARAYQDLAADGVVEGQPSRGTRILATEPADALDAIGREGAPREVTPDSAWMLDLPVAGGRHAGPATGLLRDITALSARADLISFAAGTPSPDLVPLEDLREMLDRALDVAGPAGLGYGPVEGLDGLRTVVAARMASRGVRVAPREILITAGAMQGLTLASRALIEPGDEVAVEAPAFMGTLQAFGVAGARLLPIPVDEEGLRVDLLERMLTRRRIRLILAQPTHHNPTGATLSPDRRERLVTLARRHGVPILEDDAYGELWYEGQDPRPLKAIDRTGIVLYLGTFSKTLAPGLRVGWIAAPGPVIDRLALAKELADLNTGALPQLALIEYLAGGYDRHLTRVRQAYAERRAAMLDGVRTLGGELEVVGRARGGLYLWCRLRAGPRARLLAAAAGRARVALLAGEPFYPPGGGTGEDGADHVRLSFGGSDPAAIAEGLRRLRPILEELPRMPGPARGRRDLPPLV